MFQRFTLIAGPCVLESDDAEPARVGDALASLSERTGLPIVFKASFDKANRSKLDAPRGPGLERGPGALARVRAETGLPVLTDVHEPRTPSRRAAVVDVLQIPAFLCRQTDLLVAAGAHGKGGEHQEGAVDGPGGDDPRRGQGAPLRRVRSHRDRAGHLPGLRRPGGGHALFARLRAATGSPAIFDGTHSVQRPGQAAWRERRRPRAHSRRSCARRPRPGADGLFLETHPEPATRLRDGATQWPLDRLEALVAETLYVRPWERAAAGA